MQKTISIEQVRIGMFIQGLKGSWMDHPFWKKTFLLEDQEDLQKLKSSAVKEVVIDTDKGLDVEEQAKSAVDIEPQEISQQELAPDVSIEPVQSPIKKSKESVPQKSVLRQNVLLKRLSRQLLLCFKTRAWVRH